MKLTMPKIKLLLSLEICCALFLDGCHHSETELLGFTPSDSATILIVNWGLINVANGAGFTIAHGLTNQKCAVNFCVSLRDMNKQR